MPNVPTYWDYLHVPELLSLQGGLEDDEDQLMNDELHFIVVHQVYELWFKLCIRELRLARNHLAEPHVPEKQISYVVHHLTRVAKVMGLLVDQFAIMETLTPQDFLSFRDKLTPASGFQSYQMRLVEILMGLEDEQRVLYGQTNPLKHIAALAEHSPAGAKVWAQVQQVQQEESLRSAMHGWLYRTPIQGSSPEDDGDEAVVHGFLEEYYAAVSEHQRDQAVRYAAAMKLDKAQVDAKFEAERKSVREFLFAEDVEEAQRATVKRVRAGLVFVESYRELPLLAWPRLLIDTAVEVEEQFVLFRHRHARMVERVIGRRVGTGGSSGVGYLDKTTKIRVFTELWAVRTLLLPKQRLPDIQNVERYDFADRLFNP